MSPLFYGGLVSLYVCEHCLGTAVQTANAALGMLSDRNASATTRSIAVDELEQAVNLLHLNTARRTSDGQDETDVARL
jgi:galactitol-specific phosphotransferase system IIB component